MKTLAFACLAFALSTNAFAYNGSISFSPEEKAAHAQGLSVVMDAAVKCMQDDLARHQMFIKKYGVSAFYGDNSSFAKKKIKRIEKGWFWEGDRVIIEIKPTTTEDRRNILRSLKLPEQLVQQLVPGRACSLEECPLKLQPTSCIGLALKCLGRGFQAAGQDALWSKIDAFSDANDAQGDALQYALQKLGWKIVYWNPDTSRAEEWDELERRTQPGNPKNIWGQHAYTWSTVRKQGYYYRISVDEPTSMIDFGKKVPERIRNVPFFVGIAHLGYHVFPGSYGQIIEGHSTRKITDRLTVETSAFAPLTQDGGPHGGPNGAYKSGIVAVPPGFY
ncbi:MAG TPA: hypothetical protein VIH99_01750 [Bdellovibrionota bacterium]|jgi:hypothetical protein